MPPTASPSPFTKADLFNALTADSPSHIAFLQSFIRASSPNPPGDTTAAAAILTSYLTQHGISTSTITAAPHMPNVVSVLNASAPGPCLVMNPHIDVFPVSDGDQWTHDPWSGDIEKGRIYGRGVVDMKAGTAAQVIAFAYLDRFLHLGPDSNIQRKCALVAVSDEETGGKFGSVHLLDHDERRDVWRGDVVLNAEPGGLQAIRFAEKGTLRLTFTVRTPSGHVAFMHLTEGAVRVAVRLIARLVELEKFEGFEVDGELREYLGRRDVRERIDEVMGKGAADNMLKPTVNVGTISGGNKVNTIPGKCVFETDIRLPIGLSAEVMRQRIASILESFPEASVAIQEAASNPFNSSRHDHEIVRAVQRNAEVVLCRDGQKGRLPLAIPSLGATDSKHWRYRGVPAYTYGLSPVGMGGRDESVVVDDFLRLIKIHAGVVWDWLHG